MGNKDKLNFVDQHIAAGVFNKTFKKMYEKIFPKNGYVKVNQEKFLAFII